MSDSWIDKDELDEFVGAFSKKKRQHRRPPAKPKEVSPFEPDTDEVEEEDVIEAAAEPAPVEKLEEEAPVEKITPEVTAEEVESETTEEADETMPVEESDEDEELPTVITKSVTVQVVRKDGAPPQDDTSVFADDPYEESAEDFFDSEEQATELAEEENEDDGAEEETPELEFEVASEVGELSEDDKEFAETHADAENEEPVQSSVLDEIFPDPVSEVSDEMEAVDDDGMDGIEDAGYDVATIPGLEISSPFISENIGTPIEDVGTGEELEAPLSEETISHIEVTDSNPRDEIVEHTPHFLGDIPTADAEEAEHESEVGRAIRTLADARERANASSLLKTDTHYSITDSEPTSETDGSIEEETESPLLAALKIESIGPLQQRVDQFAELAHRELSNPRVSISDVDGVYLYRDEPFEMSVSEELRMIRTLQVAGGQSGLDSVSGSQVCDGDGRWHTVFMAHGAESRLLAHFDLAEPLDPPQLEEWSKVLAEAIDPANASS